jgi:phospholipid/cholesterol/gamma-HCH transport system permease protein
MISMPLLVTECCLFAILSSYLIAVVSLGVPEAPYMYYFYSYTRGSDVAMALIKGFFFAIVIALVSCHEGLETENGAAGVGRAPTTAVVIASLAILGLNLILTFALNIIFPANQ